MRSWRPRELPWHCNSVRSRGYWTLQGGCRLPVRIEYSIGGQTGRTLEHKFRTTLNFGLFLSHLFSRASLSFPCSSLLCSRTSLAVRRLIEMCKSLWHRMNRQLLAGCPMPLCVLPLNWSAPVCLPSSLLPTLTVARFCLTSKARLCAPFKEFKTISTAVWLKRTFYNREWWNYFCHVTIHFLKSKCGDVKLTKSSHWFRESNQWLGLPAQPLLWIMVTFHLPSQHAKYSIWDYT